MIYAVECPDDRRRYGTVFGYVDADTDGEGVLAGLVAFPHAVSISRMKDRYIIWDRNCQHSETRLGFIVRRRPFAGGHDTHFILDTFSVDDDRATDTIGGDSRIGVPSDTYMIQRVRITIEPVPYDADEYAGSGI